MANGYLAFGVQDGGECYTGPKAHETFNKYGQAKDSDCKNGVGGWYRNNIYSVGTSDTSCNRYLGQYMLSFLLCMYISLVVSSLSHPTLS